jgi:hypothetical protein
MTAHLTLDDETCQEKSTRVTGPLNGLCGK